MKNNTLKRIFCLFLALTLLPLSSLPAFAASWSTKVNYKVTVAYDPDEWCGVLELKSNSDRSAKQGSTTVKKGGSVEFWAAPQHPAVFEGWYDQDGQLLSTNLYYKVTNVQSNMTVTGKFGEIYDVGFHQSHEGFTAWTDSTSMPTEAGKYYLATDVTIDKFWEAPDGIVLCLNGHVLRNTNESAAVTVNAYHQVIVTDCDTATKHYFDQNGIGAWVLNDANTDSPYSVTSGVVTGDDRCMYVYGGGVLYLCGGNAVGASGKKNGPGVSVSDGGVFYMYGGSIQGNVNTNAGSDKGDISGTDTGTVQEYDGGGGLFVDVGAYVYLGGDSLIANNTALYTNNGGGVYNYRGTVELDGNVRIENNRGENGASSNYQGYQYRGTPSLMYIYNDLSDQARIGVSMSANCAFSDYNYDDYTSNFFADDVNKKIVNSTDGENILSIASQSYSGYIVTAGTRGAGTATVNGQDGAKGVVVSRRASATLVATPVNEDYIFVGWYNQDGALITTNPTYTINAVTADKFVQAYFMLRDEPIHVLGAGTVHVFNSGDDTKISYSNTYDYRYKNPEFSTFDNGGRYLYFSKIASEGNYDEEGPVGLPFTIEGKVLEKSIVTMNCYDVDESSNERDVVYLLDLTNHTRVELGYLTGRDNTWTTTSFTIAPELLQEGHTYQLYLENQVKQWCAWIDTASISIGAMETETEVIPPVTNASIIGAINASRKVTGELTVLVPESGVFDIEYKATHIATNNQLGYAYADNQTVTAPSLVIPYSFTLESGAPEGTYRIDAYILDQDGNVLKTVSCTAGYASFAVTYHANGGTNNLPEDTRAYNAGETVTVKFDYVPSYAQTFGLLSNAAVFTGWSTDPEATEPEYTADGVNTFDIGSEDVTLYAVYHVHDYNETVNIKPASCTEDGIDHEMCSCGEVIAEIVLPATGHTMGEWIIDFDATDDTEGQRHQTCSVCGHTVTEAIPAKGHTYVSEVVAPTCTEQGYTEHTCTNENCGDSYRTDYVDALGHTEEIIPGRAPTCTESGLTEGKKCAVCGVILQEQSVIDPLGHNYVVVTTIPASCTEMGSVTSTCTGCGDTKTEDGDPAHGHSFDAVVTPANCGADGHTDYTCTVCEYAYRGDYTDATGDHVYGESTVTEPTCVDDGWIESTCTVCGYVHEEAGEAAHGNHDYIAIGEAPTCTESGVVNYTCTVCGHDYSETKDATGHTESDWIIDRKPTTLEDGEKHTECTVCGEILQTAVIYRPVIVGEGDSLVMVANGHTIENVKIAYIGEESATVTNWKEYTEAKDDNFPLKYYTDVADATRWKQLRDGYYACYIRTDDKSVFYCVARINTKMPYISGDGANLVMHAEGYTIENVKLAYIGDQAATVTTWKEFTAAKVDDVDLTFYSNPADGTAWAQKLTGYYACYIRTAEKVVYYSVAYVTVPPEKAPYISGDGANLVLHAEGFTVENVKLAYIGDQEATVTTWKEFTAAKVDDVDLTFYSNPTDGTAWTQKLTGYYACYIRTADKKVYYSVTYVTVPPVEEPEKPYISSNGNDLILNACGYTIENVKLAYIGDQEATVTTWKEFTAAKVDDVDLTFYSNPADGTAWTQELTGYYACYIRTSEIGTLYCVVKVG